jgi:hypothetical protein
VRGLRSSGAAVSKDDVDAGPVNGIEAGCTDVEAIIDVAVNRWQVNPVNMVAPANNTSHANILVIGVFI